jgi:D-xylose reductase
VTDTQTHLVLKSGDKLPMAGLGLWKMPKETCAEAVVNAVEAGYRLFDSACDYGNEKETGEGIK